MNQAVKVRGRKARARRVEVSLTQEHGFASRDFWWWSSLAILTVAALLRLVASWGDFSRTMLDPEDDKTFWTIQQVAVDTTHWATQITALHIEH